MNAKIAALAFVALCGSATAEPKNYAFNGSVIGTQPNPSDSSYGEYRCSASDLFDGLTWCHKPATGVSTESSASATAISDTDGEADGVAAPLAMTLQMAEASSSWEAAAYGFIAGLLVLVLKACAAVIYRRWDWITPAKGQELLPRRNFIELPALPITDRALSPDAALARIDEIRRSLLELPSSPSLAPPATFEKAIFPNASAELRLLEKVFEPIVGRLACETTSLHSG